MNWVDVIIAIGLVAGTLQGLRMGLVSEVAILVGIVLGVVLAGGFHDNLEPHLDFLSTDSVDGAKISAFAIIFAATFMGVQILGAIARTVFRPFMTPIVDAGAGGLLGLVAFGLLIGVAASLFGNFAGGPFQEAIQDSKLAQLLTDKVPIVLGLLPEDFKELDVLKRLR